MLIDASWPSNSARGRDEADLVRRLVDERRTARVVHGGLLHAVGAPGDRRGSRRRESLPLRRGSPGATRRDTLYDVYVNVNCLRTPRITLRTAPRNRLPRSRSYFPSQRRIQRPVASSDSLQPRGYTQRPPVFIVETPMPFGPPFPRSSGSSSPPFSPSSPAPPRPRCPPASRRARPSRGSPSTRSPTASGCCCFRTRPSRRRRSTSPISSARARRTTARPAWRTCSSTCCSRARRRFPSIFQELGRRGMRFNGSTFFDRTNYFETFTASDENLDWALGDGSRPDGELVRREEGPRHRDDGRPQRIRERREQSAARALGPVAGDGVRLAQLRQPDDRRALGHRERRHRPAAGVLQALLPARQRGADRRRDGSIPIARSRRSRRRSARFPSPTRTLPRAVHEGAGAGRRARGHRSPRRRRAVRRRALPHGARRAPGRDRDGRARRGDDRRARGPAVPRARRDEEGERRRVVEFRAGRSGRHHLLGASAAGRFARRRARRAHRHGRGRQGEADHRGRSRSRARQGAAPVRRDVQRSAEARRGDIGIDRDRRLAAVLPAARPMAQGRRPPTCSASRSNT